MTPARPFWLAAPSRFAGISRDRARATLAALAIALAVLAVLAAPAGLPDDLYAGVIVAMRHGIGFYDALRGVAPGSAEVSATLPALALVMVHATPSGVAALLSITLAAFLYTAWARIGAMLRTGAARLAAAGLLLAGAAAGAALAVRAPQPGWGALLTGWALLLRRPDRWVSAAATFTVAALVDPAAMILLGAMAAIALLEGRRNEALGWLAAFATAALALAAHRHAIHGWPPGTMPAPDAEALASLAQTAFPPLPPSLAVVTLLLALLGWAGGRGALSARILLCAVTAMAAQIASGVAAATLPVPVVGLGLVFLPDVLRDLARAAGGRRRRITVTRIRTPAGADR